MLHNRSKEAKPINDLVYYKIDVEVAGATHTHILCKGSHFVYCGEE